MLSFLKQSLARWRCPFRCQDCLRGKDAGAVPRGELGAGSLIDHEAFEAMLERSRIPAVLMLVLVWTVSSVLLILSGMRQYRTVDWSVGQHAPHGISAQVDFDYESPDKTKSKREEARKRVPAYHQLNAAATDRILREVREFFSEIDKSDSPSVFKSAKPEALAAKYHIDPQLLQELVAAYRRKDDHRAFEASLEAMLKQGVVADREPAALRIVDGEGNLIDAPPVTVGKGAGTLAGKLLPKGTDEQRRQLRELLKKLIGEQGNALYNARRTEQEREAAAKAVAPVEVRKREGDWLIRKGEPFTDEASAMLKAEREATPKFDWGNAYRRTAWSFFVMLVGVLFICFFSKNIHLDNLRIMLAGLTVSVALALNYFAIQIFKYVMQDVGTLDFWMIQAAVPVAFCAVVLSVVLDLRTAIFVGGIVALLSAMMLVPNRPLELALRWTAISSMAALTVHKVGNYRSFFVHAIITVLVLTFMLNIDMVFRGYTNKELPMAFRAFGWTVLANSAACAILTLVMIFVLELFFNLSTDMALMMLSDNHPLVERLKREADRTFEHSDSVAMLAEDAARAIGANPLRAKAGALFHDIGKLSKPQYFTENNPNSAVLHDRLKPEESAAIIISHVDEGVKLARKYRLCRFIRNVIASHHGNDLVRFFYYKAQEESKKTGVPVRDADFRYHGKMPKSKEEGIISLADACEAASRSLKNPTEESLSALVGNIIQGRFRDGMLRNSHLTAADLEILRKSFISTLLSKMHSRIAYPDAAGEEKKC